MGTGDADMPERLKGLLRLAFLFSAHYSLSSTRFLFFSPALRSELRDTPENGKWKKKKKKTTHTPHALTQPHLTHRKTIQDSRGTFPRRRRRDPDLRSERLC